MEIGVFARTFLHPTVEEVLDAMPKYGLRSCQFNMSCAGLPSMPEEVSDEICTRVRQAMADRELNMVSLSGTFNMIHPDVVARENGLRQFGVLVASAAKLGTSIVSLCTGTRNPESMWRGHPENSSSAAWRDLTASMEAVLRMAEDHNVALVMEPEVANVIDSAKQARRLVDEMQSSHLKVVFDGANIFHEGELARMNDLISESIDLLAADIIMAHAKDLDQDGAAGKLAAGTGLLDYEHYLRTLQSVGFDGPILLHGLTEAQTPGCVAFLHETLEKVGA